jgi:Na+-driven multidrug efflux pump
VTFVSCALVAAIFETLGFGVAASGRWVTWLFTNVEGVVFAGTAYFQTIGLIYGFMAVSAMLFSAYQGWGRAITPLFVSLLRLAMVLLGGWIVFMQSPASFGCTIWWQVPSSLQHWRWLLSFFFGLQIEAAACYLAEKAIDD